MGILQETFVVTVCSVSFCRPQAMQVIDDPVNPPSVYFERTNE